MPVWISVSVSKPSSCVPKPPGKSATALASITKNSLRVKKYLNVISLGSSTMTGLADCSKGSRMLTPKLFSAPAPTLPAFMMPSAAPVMTMKSLAASWRANSTAIM